MASTSSAFDSEGQIPSKLVAEVENSTNEGDFQQTIELLQIDSEELSEEVMQSVLEIEGLKQFPCEYCSKVCKSKGGRTKHVRSKHNPEAVSVNTSDKAPEKDSIEKQMPKYVTEEKLLSIIREIGKSLVDENIYQKKQVDEVFNLKPNGSFLEAVNALLHKFKRKKDRDIFIKEYYGKMYGSWKEYFHPLRDHKVVFLMMVNLPERLICLIQDPQITSDDTSELSVTPEELGPLSYVAGYVIQALYRKSKNSKNSDSPRNQEIQAFLWSMKVPTEENEYIDSISRGALWAPNSWLVNIAEISEICFKKCTRLGKPSSIPVDKIVEEVRTSPAAKSFWNNVLDQCDFEVSKECQTLCFENIVKLYVTVRSFSFARDIVNKYKLLEKTQKKKALRKQLKADSELQL